jgi:hypothetical protein
LSSPDLTDTKTWYDQTFPSCGSWDSYVWETVNGRDYATRQPHFRGFIAVTERLDRSAAQIVALALKEGKTVLGFNQGAQLLSITSLRQREDEAGGWAVSGTPIGE